MPFPTLRPRFLTLRRVLLAGAVAGVAALAALSTEALVRARLEEVGSRVPTRLYARPTVLQVGTRVDRELVAGSLRRLGYRETRGRNVRAGEYRLGDWEWLIGRRPFRLGGEADPGGLTRVRLGYWGDVEGLEDGDGRRLTRVLLEPEPVGGGRAGVNEDRIPVRLGEVPRHLVDAVLVVEDQRFFEHGGVDPRRIAGAAVANLRARRLVQGGSTITQQLAKNLFLSARRSPVRKARELAIALVLEARYAKEEILEAYLNEIYLGQDGALAIHGVGRAARFYFAKDVSRLSAAEAALLAGLIRGPSLYSPVRRPAAARERRNLVLALMRDRGVLSESAYERARRASLAVQRPAPQVRVGRYFADYVREQLAQRGRDLPVRGAAVFTSLDMQLQVAAEAAVRSGLASLEREYPRLKRGEGPLQAALVALDPGTGEVLALVGGRDYGQSQFNRAVHARRQPGSAFKPVVALAALAGGSFTLASRLEDEPLSLETSTGRWTPVNYDRGYRGAVTLREALERSLNVPFARLGLAIGAARIAETGRRLGIESSLRRVPSLALGASEVSPFELARAYGVLAAQGVRAEPIVTLGVVDPRGTIVDRAQVRTVEVVDPDAAFLVTSALEGAVARGTGQGLRGFGYWGPVAAKSGTTNDYRDAWFVGYTPSLAVAVWVGFDDGRSIGLPGARAALPIFGRFLASSGLGMGQGFVVPEGVELIEVDPATGRRAGWGCGGEPEYFLVGTAPDERTESCSWFRGAGRWLVLEGSRLARDARRGLEQDLRPLVEEFRRRLDRMIN